MPTSAHAEYTVFKEICGEFATSHRADVGIGPYNEAVKCIRRGAYAMPAVMMAIL